MNAEQFAELRRWLENNSDAMSVEALLHIAKLLMEIDRLRGWLQKIVDGPCAESHHRWAAVEALKGENCDY